MILASCNNNSDKTVKNHKSSSAHKSHKVSKNKTLVFCIPETFATMDPGFMPSSIDKVHIGAVYDGLVGFKHGTAEMEPRLAEKIDMSKDGLTYTFYLRKNVHWHTTKYFKPSRNFNADDVLFSFNRQLYAKSHYYHREYTNIQSSGIARNLKTIKKIDNYTVQFIFKKPMAKFLSNLLITSVYSIVSKEYYEKMYAQGKLGFVNRHPIGTGPWVFVDSHDGEYTRLIANKKYWRTPVKSQALIFKMVSNRVQNLNAIESGECDISYDITSADAENVKKYQHVMLLNQPILHTWHSQINFSKHPEYKNHLVMQAIAYAINKVNIIDQAFDGQATPATSLIPPRMFGHIETGLKKYKYNPKIAKRLLKKSGHAKGKGLSELTYLMLNKNTQSSKIALLIQNDLAAVGIKLKIISVGFSALLDQLSNHSYGMTTTSWQADFPDPDNFYSNILGAYNTPQNYPNWHNKYFEKLRLQSQTTVNKDQRRKIYQKMNRIYAKYLPIIPLVYQTAFIAISDKLHGYYISPLDKTDGLVTAYK